MCDYSLHGMQNRLAAKGELLIVHRFHTGSIGLTAAPNPTENPGGAMTARKRWKSRLRSIFAAPQECAVCIPPGARLLLARIPDRMRQKVGLREEEEVTFTQLTARENAYRDAIRFRDGKTLLLQRLEPGLVVQVLNLSGEVTDELDPMPISVAA